VLDVVANLLDAVVAFSYDRLKRLRYSALFFIAGIIFFIVYYAVLSAENFGWL
jgi:hypothetical protein